MFDGNVFAAAAAGVVQSQLEFSLISGTTEQGASSSDSKASKQPAANQLNKSTAGNKVG